MHLALYSLLHRNLICTTVLHQGYHTGFSRPHPNEVDHPPLHSPPHWPAYCIFCLRAVECLGIIINARSLCNTETGRPLREETDINSFPNIAGKTPPFTGKKKTQIHRTLIMIDLHISFYFFARPLTHKLSFFHFSPSSVQTRPWTQ